MRRIVALLALLCAPALGFAQTLPSPQVAIPTLPTQATPKGYVDAGLSAKRDATLFPTPQDNVPAGQAAALATGGMNAAPAVQAAWAKGAARIPCGQYRLDTPLIAPASNTALLAESNGCVQVVVTFTNGDVVTLPAGMTNITISGIQFVTSVVRTSGAAIHVAGATNTLLHDLKIEKGAGGQWWDGLLVSNGAVVTRVGNFYFSDMGNDCIRLENRVVDTFIATGNTAGCNIGIRLRSASGVFLSYLDLVGSTNIGLVVDPVLANGDSVDAVTGDTVLSDTSGNAGILLGGTGRITEFNVVNLWASASGTSGVFTPGQVINNVGTGMVIDNENVNGVALASPRFKGNGGHGIQIIHGSNIILTGAQALMNGASFGTVPPSGGPASTLRLNGIQIEGQATNISIFAPIAGQGGWEPGVGLPQKQGYGLFRNATGTGGQMVTLIGGQFNGNVIGTYLLSATTGDHIVDLGNQ